jgi:hypothetical protein
MKRVDVFGWPDDCEQELARKPPASTPARDETGSPSFTAQNGLEPALDTWDGAAAKGAQKNTLQSSYA